MSAEILTSPVVPWWSASGSPRVMTVSPQSLVLMTRVRPHPSSEQMKRSSVPVRCASAMRCRLLFILCIRSSFVMRARHGRRRVIHPGCRASVEELGTTVDDPAHSSQVFPLVLSALFDRQANPNSMSSECQIILAQDHFMCAQPDFVCANRSKCQVLEVSRAEVTWSSAPWISPYVTPCSEPRGSR